MCYKKQKMKKRVEERVIQRCTRFFFLTILSFINLNLLLIFKCVNSKYISYKYRLQY